MRTATKLLYLASFAALAVVTALAAARVARPSIASADGGGCCWRRWPALRGSSSARLARRADPAAGRRVPRHARRDPHGERPRTRRSARLLPSELRAGAHAYSTRTLPPFSWPAPPASSSSSCSPSTRPPTGRARRRRAATRTGGGRRLPARARLQPDGPTAPAAWSWCRSRFSSSGRSARSLALGRARPGALPPASCPGRHRRRSQVRRPLARRARPPSRRAKKVQDWSTWGPGRTGGRVGIAFNWMLNSRASRRQAQRAGPRGPVPRFPSVLAGANASVQSFTGQAWLAAGSPARPLVSAPRASPIIPTQLRCEQPRGTSRPATRSSRSSSSAALSTDYLVSGGATPTSWSWAAGRPASIDSSEGLRLPQPLGPKSSYAVTVEIPHLTPADLVARPGAVTRPTSSRPRAALPTAADMTGPDPRRSGGRPSRRRAPTASGAASTS